MSFYFCSGTKNQIKALTGTKSIVIRDEDADEILKILDIDLENQEKISEHIEDVLNIHKSADYLKEEWDHYDHLSKSVVSNSFYIGNIFLRLSFSSINKNLGRSNYRIRLVDRQIVKYYLNYTKFYYSSSPILEAAYMHKSQMTEDEKKNYGDAQRIKEALSRFKSGQYTLKEVPQLLDLCYHSFNQTKTFWKSRMILKTYRRQVVPILLNIQLYPRLFYILRQQKWGKIVGHVLKKALSSSSSKKFQRQTFTLPALEIGRETIDPVGFLADRKYSNSQEVRLPLEQKRLTDFYWAILCRVAEVYQIMVLTNGKFDIEKYYQLYRRFVQEWLDGTGKEENLLDIMLLSKFDNTIIDKVKVSMKRNKNLSSRKLRLLAKHIYNKWNREHPQWLGNTGFTRAMGAYYLQV